MRFLTENATSNTKLKWTIDKLSGLAWEQAIRNYITKNNLPLNFRDNNLEVEEIIRSKGNVFFDENGNLLEESNSSSTVSFEVGDMFEREGLYGGSYDCKVVARKGNKISVKETWVAEDTGKNVSAVTTYDVQVDDEGEYIVIWEYSGEEGRIYAHDVVKVRSRLANNNNILNENSEAYSDNINISDIEDVLTAIKDKFPEAHAIYDGDSKEITISLTESKAATNQTELLKSIVKLLYQMDSMIQNVDDNETWLTYGVPDGEFTEATAQEAAMNYRDHDWLVCDITDDNVIDVSLVEDFFNLFQRITKNPDYDQNERSFILKKAKMILNQLS